MSDITDGRSRQERIADDLRARIKAGEYGPGDKLPGLPELAEDYNVSLVTVRYAIGKLRAEGLVMSIQGKGNFVKKPPPVQRHGIERYSRSTWGGRDPMPLLQAEGGHQGRAVGQDTAIETGPAPEAIAQRLGIATGEIVHIRRRVTTLDGVINQFADSYFTLATGERSADLVAGRGPGGHIARINAISPVLEVEEEIECRMPTGPEASRLEIPEGTPVQDVLRTYHTEDGPLDVAHFVIRGDMVKFRYRFPIPD